MASQSPETVTLLAAEPLLSRLTKTRPASARFLKWLDEALVQAPPQWTPFL